MVFYKGLLPDNKLHHSLVKIQLDIMAEVLRRKQKYINLEEELEAQWLRKIVNLDRKVSDDLKRHDEANRAF